MQRKTNSPFRQVKTFSAGDFFFFSFLEYKSGGGESKNAVALRAGSAERMYNTDPREMINGAIKELMRGILIAAEPINQLSRALEERNEKAGQRAGGLLRGWGRGLSPLRHAEDDSRPHF